MRLIFRAPATLLLIILLSGFGSGERLFAPDADLWERWQAHDPASTAVIDHSPWDGFLKRHVVADPAGANLVRYADVSTEDRLLLDNYIAGLAGLPVSRYGRDEQLAYWMNLYNALTVQVVLTHYPVDSIRDIDISPGFFSDGPWGKKLVTIEGEQVSLNDIEHRILRPVWRDPRIHYGVNCASIGCPDLRRDAFTAENTDAALTAAARDYVNDSRGVSVEGDSIMVSRIYDWFIADFGGDEAGVIAHLLRYAEPELAAILRRKAALDDTRYDWSLNDR
ncbi:DUF547 domain-containing protein [Alphaproteobacteria bacterium HT1-32]|nr:DUF547 domain-containing protein [Alphaproteobacteria bacterium HT1-32]